MSHLIVFVGMIIGSVIILMLSKDKERAFQDTFDSLYWGGWALLSHWVFVTYFFKG